MNDLNLFVMSYDEILTWYIPQTKVEEYLILSMEKYVDECKSKYKSESDNEYIEDLRDLGNVNSDLESDINRLDNTISCLELTISDLENEIEQLKLEKETQNE